MGKSHRILSGKQLDITRLLQELTGGNRTRVDVLVPVIYDQLYEIASRQLRKERQGHTLNATALVNEAYLKLVQQDRVNWQNRAHFLSVASIAMRRVLINYAKSRSAAKRGGGNPVVTFNEELHQGEMKSDELLELDYALEELSSFDERQSKVVELSFFGGLTHEEIAEVLKVSIATVRRDWRIAKAWLSARMRDRRDAADT